MAGTDPALTEPIDAAALVLYQQIIDDLARSGGSARIGEVEAAIEGPLSLPVKAQLANLLAHHHFQKRRYEDALAACRRWTAFAPDNTVARDSLLSILTRLGRFDEVISESSGRLESEPDNFRLRSSLCQALGRTGKLDEARQFGTACLALKDRAATGEAIDIHRIAVPQFDPSQRGRNIIAFSLFGSDAMYAEGAVRNAVAAHFLYPEWTCRFYIDETV